MAAVFACYRSTPLKNRDSAPGIQATTIGAPVSDRDRLADAPGADREPRDLFADRLADAKVCAVSGVWSGLKLLICKAQSEGGAAPLLA